MSPFHFVNASSSGGSLMPILVFAVWIVISFFSNAQKKKKGLEQKQQKQKIRPPETYHAPESSVPPEKMTQHEQQRAPIFDEVRRDREDLSSGQTAREKQTASHVENDRFSLATHNAEEQSYEASVPLLLKSTLPIPPGHPPVAAHFNAYDLTIPPGDFDGIASSAITDVFSKEAPDKGAARLLLAHEEVRNGFVWSEILAAPVALRDGA